MTVAVDFDNTLAKTKYPEIIEPIEKTIHTMIELREMGVKVILWTCRKGEALEDALNFCKEHGLEFDAVNAHLPEDIEKWGGDTRKLWADAYVDDKAYNIKDLGRLYWDALGITEKEKRYD